MQNSQQYAPIQSRAVREVSDLGIKLRGLFLYAVELLARPHGVTKSEERASYLSKGKADSNSYIADIREERLLVIPSQSQARQNRLNERNRDLAGSPVPFPNSLASHSRYSGQEYFARYFAIETEEKRGGEPVWRLLDLQSVSYVVASGSAPST